MGVPTIWVFRPYMYSPEHMVYSTVFSYSPTVRVQSDHTSVTHMVQSYVYGRTIWVTLTWSDCPTVLF